MPLQSLINTGQAQVLPVDDNVSPIFDRIERKKQLQTQNNRYNQEQSDKKERELYSLIGDSLNPKDFNTVIQDKVMKAQKDLAAQIKLQNPSYGEAYMMAQNAAGQLSKTSQSLNKIDQQIALTKKEYEQDKRINSGAIEIAARKKILDQLNTTGKVDENVNYFDDVLNNSPDIGLVDKSDATYTDFKPEEKQPLKFNIRKKNGVGKTNQYTWEMDNYPAYYDVKQKGDYEPPDIKVKSQPSGIKDASGNELPMLSEDAYSRFSLTPSNVVAINRRIKREHPDIDLQSRDAEKLRKVEAYNEVKRNIPVPKESRVETEPKIIINNNSGSNKNAGADWVVRASEASKSKDPQKIEDEFAQLFQGDKNSYQKVELNGDKLNVTYKVPEKRGLLGDVFPEEPKTVSLDINDRYLSQKLANLYQTIVGGDVNVERTNYSQTKKPAQRTGVTVLAHARQDFKDAGWTEDQIDKAVKAGKIKVN